MDKDTAMELLKNEFDEYTYYKTKDIYKYKITDGFDLNYADGETQECK